MRSIDRRQLLVVLLAISLLVVPTAAGLSTAFIENTQSDFQSGTLTGDVETFSDDKVGIRPGIGSTTTVDITPVDAVNDDGGVTFVPNKDLPAISVTRFGETTFRIGDDIELQDSNGYTLIEKSADSPKTVFEYDFQSGVEYKIYYRGDVNADGVKNQSQLNAPYTSNDIDITGPAAGDDIKNVESITAVTDPKDGGTYTTTKTVTGAEKAFVDFSKLEGSAEVQIQNESTTIVDDTFGSGGKKEFGITPTGEEEYTIVVDYNNAPDEEQTVDGLGIEFESSNSTFSNSSPSGGVTVTDAPVELGINVSDADFGTAQGDSVDVTFYDGDDNQLGTDTLSSNGTATSTFTSPTGGENTWYVEATDSYGNTVRSTTFSFNAPKEVEIRDEQTGDLLADANISLEFYQQSNNPDNIESVPVTNGVADMTGLPAEESFIAVATADGYADRRIFIDSLLETQTIYLLNESADSVAVEYELSDFSGDYPQQETVMVIEKNINGEWTPIQGDFFGATGKFTAQLERDARHRARVVNVATGEDRVIGAFTPQGGTETVTILPDGSITVDRGFDRVFAQPAIGSIPAAQGAEFGVDIREGDEPIESWDIEIILMTENGTTTLATRSGSGASVESFALDLRDSAGASVVANVNYSTPTQNGTVRLSRSVRENYAGAEGLLGGVTTIGDGLGADDDGSSGASMMASLFISLLITAGVARVSTSPDVMGLTALLSVTGFAFIGWVPFTLLFAATAGFAAVIALRRGI